MENNLSVYGTDPFPNNLPANWKYIVITFWFTEWKTLFSACGLFIILLKMCGDINVKVSIYSESTLILIKWARLWIYVTLTYRPTSVSIPSTALHNVHC